MAETGIPLFHNGVGVAAIVGGPTARIVLRTPHGRRSCGAGVGDGPDAPPHITGERVVEIAPDAVVPDARRLDCETAILAVGYIADTALSNDLKARGVAHVLIGDAVKPRRIRDAVVEGYEAGLALGVPPVGVDA